MGRPHLFPFIGPKTRWILSVLMVGLLGACTTAPAPQVSENTYTASIQIDADDNQKSIEDQYSAEVVVWRPEANFAILKVKETSQLQTLNTLEPNTDVFSVPTVQSAGFRAWSGGFRAWSGGFRAWSGGFRAWSGGQETLTPMDNLDPWIQIGLPYAHLALTPKLGDTAVVAVIDTGIDHSHPAFEGRLVPGWDFVDDDSNPQEVTGGTAYGHGTAVSGIVLQVAPKAKIMPLRVLDQDGLGDTDDVAAAIDWAAANGARIINLSLGANQNSQVLTTMATYAAQKGIFMVTSAGNEGLKDQLTYPAASATASGLLGQYLMSVGSVNASDLKSSFSNYGSGLDILAPGEGIFSAAPDNQFSYWTGTSFAAPIVTGTLALGVGEGMDPSQTKKLLDHTERFTDDVGRLPGNAEYRGSLGKGRLNLANISRGAMQTDFIVEPLSPFDLNFATTTGEIKFRIRSLVDTYNHTHIKSTSYELRGDSGTVVKPARVEVTDQDTLLVFTDRKALLGLLKDKNVAPNSQRILKLRFAVGTSAAADRPAVVLFEDNSQLWVNTLGGFTTQPESNWDVNFATTTGEVKVRIYDATGGYNHRHINLTSVSLKGTTTTVAKPTKMNVLSEYTELVFTDRKALFSLFSSKVILRGTQQTLNLSFALKIGTAKTYPLVVTFNP